MRSKKAIINVITTLILQIITLVCGFIIPRLIIENFGSNVNGLVVSITQFLTYIALLEAGFGPVVASILYKPIADKDKSKIEKILKSSEKFFRNIAYIFILYIIVLCFILPQIFSNEFNKIFTLSLIVIIATSTFAEYYFGMTYRLYLQSEQKTYVISIIQIVTTLVNTIMIVILIKFGASIQFVKLISAFIFVLKPILQNLYVKKKYNINLNNVKGDFEIKQKWAGLAQHIAGVIHGKIDVVVLTIFSNIKYVSIYSIYILIIDSIRNLISMISSSIFAAFGDMLAKNETENLNKKFSMYEFVYFSIITIIYSCTILLIIPFVKLYTEGITDANYVQGLFAYILVFAYFIHALKTPYHSLSNTAGKFKETQKGAWVEAISNLIISLILVHQLGLVGVAIGTLISVLIRGIEMTIFATKNILDRTMSKSFIRILISVVELVIIAFIGNYFAQADCNSYISWIIEGCKMFIISLAIVVPVNILVYKNDVKELLIIINNLKRRT